MTVPVRYARNGDVSLAYQVLGEGERHLILSTGWTLSFESLWEDSTCARALERMASFCRLVLWDKRGTGLSDRVPPRELPTLEERMEDLGAVLDAVGSERAALFGFSEGGSLSALFAATHPDRTTALILSGTFARAVGDDDYPWMPARDGAERWIARMEKAWGTSAEALRLWSPRRADDRRLQEWWMRAARLGASPAAATAWMLMAFETDIREVLPAISAPTVVMHAADDVICPVGNGRYLAGRIPGARYVELQSDDHLWWLSDPERTLEEIEALVCGAPSAREPERALVTVLFTDIVDSTRKASELGDSAWRDLVESHDRTVRAQLDRFSGTEVKTMGDGFLARFDGPARAIRCAHRIRDAVRELGIEIRAGVHTGEVELLDDDLGGIAVNIGARVEALAGPGEVLVSRTVKDLVAGSRAEFEERGVHELKGVPGEWELYAVRAPG